jgi:outer membrane protein OmpA-like peptidoglycan-associated protein
MSARRRGESETGERIWKVYADQIGLPEAGPARSDNSVPQESIHRVGGRRLVRFAARLLAATSVVIVVAGGMFFWLNPSASRDIVDRRSNVMARRSAPDAAVPTERVDPPRRQPTPDATVPTPMAMPPSNVVEMSGSSSAATKHESVEVTYRISFDFASDQINAESKQILDEIVVAMDANPRWRLTIEGHTDAHGTPAHNQALSVRRAEAASAYLQLAGIGAERLRTLGFGASRPLAPNTVLGSLRNRRVELRRQ